MRLATSGVTEGRSPLSRAWTLLFEMPAALASFRMSMELPPGAQVISPRST